MLDHPKDLVNNLISSGELDNLLVAARKHAEALKPAAARTNAEVLAARVQEACKEAEASRDKIVSGFADQARQRAEKVAIVRDMLFIGSRLLPA